MPRFFALLALAVVAMSSVPASAQTLTVRRRVSAPELGSTGTAAGLVLVGGAAAILLGRRRSRKP